MQQQQQHQEQQRQHQHQQIDVYHPVTTTVTSIVRTYHDMLVVLCREDNYDDVKKMTMIKHIDCRDMDIKRIPKQKREKDR